MMAFRIARGGYRAMATPEECELICGLVHDVVYILGSDVEDELVRAQEREEFLTKSAFEAVIGESDDLHPAAADGQLSATEEDLFAALEDEFAAISERIEDEANNYAADLDAAPAQQDDALARLLPDMSEDPDIATELRELTEESVSIAKVENLVLMYQTLHRVLERADDLPNDPGSGALDMQNIGDLGANYPEAAIPDQHHKLMHTHHDVFVSNEDAPRWLAAMNDIRLVLATRLEIDNEAMNESVYERAQLFTSHSVGRDENVPEIESPEDMMTVLYAMLSWWQESLVNALRNKAWRH
ncbi:DUF2017 family protein [Arcanobacterium hippocoleae]|uniref:DUF2017 family protein n=1 Tax=Arcanobacterium hippocoleae TaxID=149017 RepID=UPI00333EDD64